MLPAARKWLAMQLQRSSYPRPDMDEASPSVKSMPSGSGSSAATGSARVSTDKQKMMPSPDPDRMLTTSCSFITSAELQEISHRRYWAPVSCTTGGAFPGSTPTLWRVSAHAASTQQYFLARTRHCEG